jgi:hypothetical protein
MGYLRCSSLGSLVVVLALGVVPAANAATLKLAYTAQGIVYTASTGENNGLTITPEGGRVTIADPGAGSIRFTTSGNGKCTAVAATVVSCTAANIPKVVIALGDGDDTASVGIAVPTTIDGGSGNDRFVDGPGPEQFTGGDGVDTVDYSASIASVAADPDGVADDGVAGEGDNIGTDVENIVGGAGDDTLTAGPNGGTLQGGLGADTFNGGAGDDRILSRDGVADRVLCGAGSDTVIGDPLDKVDASCEKVDVPTVTGGGEPTGDNHSSAGSPAPGGQVPTDNQGHPLPAPDIVLPVQAVTQVAAGVLQVQVGCSEDSPDDVCQGEMWIELPMRDVTQKPGKAHAARGHYVIQSKHRRFRVQRGKTLATSVRLALRGHWVIRNRKHVRAELKVVQRDASGKVLGVTSRPVVLDRKWSRRGVGRKRRR